MAKGKFTSTGGAQIVNLPFQPDYVELINYTASAAFTDHRVLSAQWDVNMGQGFAITQVKNTTYQTDSVIANGISTFSAGLLLQYGARQQVVTITKANPAVVTVTGHGYSTGDVVVFQGLYQSASTGMPQIDGIPFTITVSDANTFTIPWNTNQSEYTGISASPSGAYVKKVLYPYLYAPGTSVISAITTGTTTTIDTTSAHNLVVGQEVAFRVPSSWGTTELNSLPNTTVPGSPVYGYVVAVTDYNTVVVNINSTSYTAFDSNQAFASVSGQQFAQMVAVGDVNTGGVAISSGSALYPSPYTMPIGTTTVNTINGPAIKGAYFNNTSQGFIVGAGACVTDTAAVLVGAASDVIYWRAFLHDMSIP
jgi:hypothetical protein